MTRTATGTPLASGPDPVVEEVRSSFKKGTVVTATLVAAILGVLVASGMPTWRVLFCTGAFAVAMLGQVVAVIRLGRSREVANATWTAQLVGLVGLAGVFAMTGGLQSPLLPTLAAGITGPLVGISLPRQRRVYFGGVVVLVALEAFLPPPARGPAIAWPYGAALGALAIAWAILVVRGSAHRIESATRRAAEAIDELRGERVNEALAQARRLQSVGAKVAHELKNPLAAIKGLAQLLSRSAADQHTQERLTVVQSEVDRMQTILGEYLSFSRPLEDLHPSPVDLSALVADVVAVLSARAETGGVHLEAAGEAPVVEGDRRRLKEALINLVSNAIEATPRGGRVTVRMAPDEGGARLEIADTGRGIGPDDMSRLGQSYFTTREGGTGLGFVLAKSAVSQHGGKLEVSSEVGRGTTIAVRLPLRQEKREEAQAHG